VGRKHEDRIPWIERKAGESPSGVRREREREREVVNTE
jgi:hypothetical protein